MSNREARSFLEAICANPDDDTTRLVYADWLDEHGHAPRAEFIRTQVERAGLPEWDGRRFSLTMREKALLDRYQAEWRAELPSIRGVTWGEFRRGFIATAHLSNIGQLEEIGARAPVEAVELSWPHSRDAGWTTSPSAGLRELALVGQSYFASDVARLADSPILSTLRALTVRSAPLQAEGFRGLIASPHLRGLRALRVPNNSVGNGAVDALVAATTLPSLEELDLSEESYGHYAEDPRITESGVLELAGWPGLAGLRTLVLSGNDLQRGGLRVLLQSPHVVGLKKLIIRSTELNGAAMREFGAARSDLALEVLDVGENLIKDAGVAHLARALRGLKALHVGRCELGPGAAENLATAEFFPGLRLLSANDNNFGPQGLTALLRAEPAALHTLLLPGNDLGDPGACVLATSPASNTLLSLDLSSNRLTDESARVLGSSGCLRSLRVLQVTNNWLSKPAQTALSASPLARRLAVLEISPSDGDPIPF
jgi:uncharacterized protein (TIGR02996 family)